MTLTVDPATIRISTPRAVCAGNIAAMGASTFVYDGENRMVSSTLNGTTTAYSYEGEGRHAQKTTDLATASGWVAIMLVRAPFRARLVQDSQEEAPVRHGQRPPAHTENTTS